jgi:hypothetical protein
VKTNAVVGVALLAVAVGAGGGWLAAKQPASDAEKRAEQAEARAKDLEQRLARVEAQAGMADASARLDAPPPPAVAAAPAPAPAPAPMADASPPATAEGGDASAAARGARFLVPGREQALKDVDWRSIGTNASAMVPLLGELGKSLAAGETMPPDVLVRINEHNAPLVTGAVKYATATGRGLTDVNAGFSEPAFMANAIAATLAAAKLPLSDAQAQSIERLAVQSTQDDKVRLASYGERTLELEKTLGDSETRDRFLQAALGALTTEQRAVLVAPSLERRLQADIFSAGIMWVTHAQILPFEDKDRLVASAEGALQQHAQLPAAEKDTVHAAVVDWANGFSRDVLEVPADGLTMQGMVPLDRTHDAARRQITLLQRLIDSGRFDAKAVESLRSMSIAMIPVKRPPSGSR